MPSKIDESIFYALKSDVFFFLGHFALVWSVMLKLTLVHLFDKLWIKCEHLDAREDLYLIWRRVEEKPYGEIEFSLAINIYLLLWRQ